MKRGYTALEYKSIVRRLRAARPDLSLSSDFIVGFPGETDADFAQTMKLVDDVALRRRVQLHLQPAARARRPPSSPTRCRTTVKQARLQRLQARVEAQYRARERRDGRHAPARAGRPARRARTPRELAARTENNRVVNFAGPARSSARYVDVAITHALPHSLRGELRRRTASLGSRFGAQSTVQASLSQLPFVLRVRRQLSKRSPMKRFAPRSPRSSSRSPSSSAAARPSAARRRARQGDGEPPRWPKPPRAPPPRTREPSARRAHDGHAPGARQRLSRPPSPRPRPPQAAAQAAQRERAFADVIKDAKEDDGLLHALDAEGRQGLDRDRARAVRQAVLPLVEPEPRPRREPPVRRADDLPGRTVARRRVPQGRHDRAADREEHEVHRDAGHARGARRRRRLLRQPARRRRRSASQPHPERKSILVEAQRAAHVATCPARPSSSSASTGSRTRSTRATRRSRRRARRRT